MRFKILQTNARRRGIEISLAPVFMQRHLENISFWYTKEKIMYWVLELKIEKSIRPNLETWDMEKEPQYHSIIIEP